MKKFRNINIIAVVVTFNRKILLEECIKSLLEQTYPLKDIYIVDNCSTDRTKEYLKEKKLFNKIKYFRLKENSGGAGGFNFGFYKAKNECEWIWAMDDDAVPQKNALKFLISDKNFDEKNVGALVSKIIYPKNSIDRTIDSVIKNDYIFRNNILKPKDFRKENVEIFTYPLLGILFKSKIINEIGNVNKDFFIQCDDLDFTLRISKRYKMIWIKKSIILHKEFNTFNEKIFFSKKLNIIGINSLWKEYYGIRNHLYIMNEYNMLSIQDFFKYLKYLVLIIIIADKKFIRIRIFYESIKDGLLGNLGKKYTPENLKINYK